MNNTSASGVLGITKLQYLKLRGKDHGGECAFKALLHLPNSNSILEYFKI